MRQSIVARLCLAAVFASLSARSAVPVDGLYEGVVGGDSTESGRTAAATDALRQVVVRVTGRGTAAADPALEPLYADAARFAQTFRSVAPGQVAVSFEPALVEAALVKAGQRLWGRDRAQVLVVVDVPAAAAAAVRRDIATAAQGRGLPVTFADAKPDAAGDVADGKGEALKAWARSAATEEALLVRSQNGTLQGRWSGVIDDGAAGGSAAEIVATLADRIGSRQALSLGDGGPLRVVVHGVTDLKAYAAVMASVSGLPAVRSVAVESLVASTIKLRVAGGADAAGLRKAAHDAGHLDVAEGGGSREVDLVYRP